uniref:FLYWCH-type domain-containing protein n=1 Tax=Macrostomum lignano TaxID=282301 RepID=A0A1I8J146_9PLAT
LAGNEAAADEESEQVATASESEDEAAADEESEQVATASESEDEAAADEESEQVATASESEDEAAADEESEQVATASESEDEAAADEESEQVATASESEDEAAADEESEQVATASESEDEAAADEEVVADDGGMIHDLYESVSDPEPRPIVERGQELETFEVMQDGGSRGNVLVISSNGYSYGLHRRRGAREYYRCTQRSRHTPCCATLIRSAGEEFKHGKSGHSHAPTLGASATRKIYRDVKVAASTDVFKSAAQLTDDRLLRELTSSTAANLPNPTNLIRAANRFRERGRPEEPKDLNFQLQLEALPNGFLRSDVQSFVLDFEHSVWKAIRRVFPNASVRGCNFHWTQAVWRKVQNIGLQQSYQEDEGTQKFVRKIMALPYLPADTIVAAFDELRTENAVEADERLVELCNYVSGTWLTEGHQWTPGDISVFGQPIRTNNDLEGWHYRLNRKAGRRNLHFYLLVCFLVNSGRRIELFSPVCSDIGQSSILATERYDSFFEPVVGCVSHLT